MELRKISTADARFEPAADEGVDMMVGNVVDQRHGGPLTIGYGRYAPHQSMDAGIVVHDVMIVLEGRVTVTGGTGPLSAGPGEIIYMIPGDEITIATGAEGALTAYVTHPHWQEAEELATRFD